MSESIAFLMRSARPCIHSAMPGSSKNCSMTSSVIGLSLYWISLPLPLVLEEDFSRDLRFWISC